MRKLVLILLVSMICLSGCSKKNETDSDEGKNETVEVDESLLSVTITLPESFFESFDTTAEEYVNNLGDKEEYFKNVSVNDDGSVSITMSRSKYKEFMEELAESIDQTINEMIDSSDYAIDSIEHDKSFSEFKIYLSNDEVGFAESFIVLIFAMYGGIYQLFDGSDNASVKVIYIGISGNELKVWDSSKLSEVQ